MYIPDLLRCQKRQAIHRETYHLCCTADQHGPHDRRHDARPERTQRSKC